jgi:undecaprenyl-diphosphatase
LQQFIANFDLYFSNFIRAARSPILDPLVHALTAITYGGIAWLLLALIIWRRGYRLLAIQISISIAIGLAETSILKHIFHRVRPVEVDLYQFWLPMHNVFADKYSFPSGHTVLSFAAAGVISMTMRDKRGALALFLALAVGVSRIYEGMHWPTDVFAGIFLGLLAARLACILVAKIFPAMTNSKLDSLSTK